MCVNIYIHLHTFKNNNRAVKIINSFILEVQYSMLMLNRSSLLVGICQIDPQFKKHVPKL